MSIIALSGLKVFLLLSIIFLAFKTLTIVTEVQNGNKFILKGVLQTSEKKEFLREKLTLLEKLLSFRKYMIYLEMELQNARLQKTAKRFVIERTISAVLLALLVFMLYSFSGNSIFLYLVIPMAIIGYKIPKRALKKTKQNYINRMKTELPEYLHHFAVLLDDYMPFDATKKSVKYAGPLLQPYVNRLVDQISMYPASHRPYYEFAESIGLREAKEFVVALEQLMKVDSKAASKIINDQIQIMNQLQEEAFNDLIEARPDKVEPYINAMLFPFVALILTIIFVLGSSTFSQL